jgi:dTDP-4-dehydrorhamnose 3,5-epimerase
MEVVDLGIQGLLLLRPRIFRDERGWFFESYSETRHREAGLLDRYVQDNHSRSSRDTLRGLHYQERPGQAKLIRVVSGRILDVAVDIRPHSPTFGRWVGVELDAERHEQIYMPIGFAHGFCVLSDIAEVVYKVSAPYDSTQERTITWNDSDIGVKWPTLTPILSARDQQGESFASYRKRVSG